jgi:hypothetical protein
LLICCNNNNNNNNNNNDNNETVNKTKRSVWLCQYGKIVGGGFTHTAEQLIKKQNENKNIQMKKRCGHRRKCRVIVRV